MCITKFLLTGYSLMSFIINYARQEAGEKIRTILFDILTASAIIRAADEHVFLTSNKSNDLFLGFNYTIKNELMKDFVESAYKVMEYGKSFVIDALWI